jgi:hypothetical protein
MLIHCVGEGEAKGVAEALGREGHTSRCGEEIYRAR